MALTQAEVSQIAQALNRLSASATAELDALWKATVGTGRAVLSDALVEGWLAITEKYGTMSATLAADVFGMQAADIGFSPVLKVAPGVQGKLAAARLKGALRQVNQASRSRLVMDELVKQPYRSTIKNSAHASGVAYARVPVGTTCAFCTMLCSRGAVYHSETSASKCHGGCDCVFLAVRDKRDYPEGYDPDALGQSYTAAVKATGKTDLKSVLSEMRKQTGIGH